MFVETEEKVRLRRAFEDFVASSDFPCVGAKSAMSRGSLHILVGWSITSGWNDLAIHSALVDWARYCRRNPGLFRSLAVIFASPAVLREEEFEEAMWDRLQSLTDKDAWRGQKCDPRVSNDPESPHFSLSFGGAGFFAVGLHPTASRPARRFERPAIVFNVHEQFEQLRREGRYEKIRSSIMERDIRLAGSPNPMLARHGQANQAAQYSGRRVGRDWTCPFRDARASQ